MQTLDSDGQVLGEGKVVKLFSRNGMERVAIQEAGAGDIVSIAGFSTGSVNATLCHPGSSKALPIVPIDPPTVSMTFSVNDSPLQGKEGSKLTSTMIGDRLLAECETNVAMKVIPTEARDAFEVRGRGELHIGILIENMRREGFEFSVSPPRVILKRDKENKKQLLEPIEEAQIEVPNEHAGMIIQKLNKRKGEMKEYTEVGDRTKLTFEIPSRGLLGFGPEFKNDTSGQGLLNHIFIGYEAFRGPLDKLRKGSLVATAAGEATAHSLLAIEPRGTLFIDAGDQVYQGMVVGENNKEHDLEVNPAKLKHLSNVRAVCKDEFVRLSPPRKMPLEHVLSYIQDDEVMEVTPKAVRIRKKVLEPNQRKSKVSKMQQDNLVIVDDE
jgi:GTP-binding protein